MEVDLSEFVSDYLAMADATGDHPASAESIAEAYCDTTVETEMSHAEFKRLVEETVPRVRYYLP